MLYETNRKLIAAATLALSLSLTVAGCTKTREAAFPDGQGEDIIKLSVFKEASVTVKASGQAARVAAADRLRASHEGEKVRIAKVDAPRKLEAMFKDLWITGDEGRTYQVRFSVNPKYVTAYKVAQSADELSAEEKSLAELSPKNELLVPLFVYPVKAYGDVVRSKNDLKEETSTLRLEETEWEKASYIQVSTRSADRIEVSPDAEESQRIFLKGRIDGQLVSKTDLRESMDIRIAGPENAKYLTRLEGDRLNLFEVLSIDSPELSDEQREIIRNGTGRNELSRCDDALKARVSSEIDAQSCVAVLRYKILVTPVVARRKTEDYEGTLSPSVEYRAVAPTSFNELVEIQKNPEPVEMVAHGDASSFFDGSRTLVVDQVKDKEFLFRRTLEDSPNTFDFTFAGESGPLEIVKFVFEKSSVKIVRSQPLLKVSGTSSVDNEPLMIIPARYFKEVKVDEKGVALVESRFVEVPSTEKGAIAYVDWSANKLPNVSSPLNFYGLEQCFVGSSDQTVSDVDQRLSQGVLNLSVSKTYTAVPDCAAIGDGYFDQSQTNFVFKERISFLKYDSKGDETPLLDLPYETQKRLGFGLFTYSKKSPNKYGNTGVIGTETPLPALFDIREGKQVTYVLAGLPASGVIRDKVIQATREVIADWNTAFRRAFEGTPMERAEGSAGDVLVLKVEGVDIAPGKLGDLDRNYIYYIQKPTSSSVIGLGGAHANPRSGKVEAASVFMYGGNIFGAVESIKKVNAAKKSYLLKMAATPEESAPTNSGATGRTASREIPIEKSAFSLNDQALALKAQASAQDLADGFDLASAKASAQSLAGRAELGERARGQAAEWLASQTLGKGAPGSDDQAMGLSLYQAFRDGAKSGKLSQAGTLETLVNERMLENLGERIGDERAITRLKAQVSRSKAMARISERMSESGICMYDGFEGIGAAAANSAPDASDEDLFVGIFKPTLAHELGHNLGLRHNFIGSYDKANFKFFADEKTKRNYSSVMDYMSDDHETYDGLGPQDVMSIRAAYTGMIELTKEAVKKLPPSAKANVKFGNLIRLEDYRRLLGLVSWTDLSARSLKALPIKTAEFCSDEDVLSTPVCNRFDSGTTPEEVVQHAIDDYHYLYSLVNFPNDKLRFGWWDAGGYINRLFSRFLPIRMFLEETVYQLLTGGGEEAIKAYLPAAIEGLQFFQSVVRTPDMKGGTTGDARFVQLQGKDGSKVVVERKWLNNLLVDEKSDRLLVRGIEFDKVVAMLMLTERSFGFRRYERVSLHLAYPDLEKLLLKDQAKSALDLPTIDLLSQVLTDEIQTAAPTAAGMVKLPGSFKAEVSSMMRFYAVLGGILNLDVEGLEASDNNSALFRVMSAYEAPKGVQTLMQLGGKEGNDLQYWAANGAEVSDLIIGKAAVSKAVLDVRDDLVKDLKEWFVLKLVEMGKEENKTEQQKKMEEAAREMRRRLLGDFLTQVFDKTAVQAAEEKLNAKLAKLPEAVGPRTVNDLGGMMFQLAGLTMKLKNEAQKQGMSEEQLGETIESLRNETTELVKNAPIFSAAFLAIPAEEIGLPEIAAILPQDDLVTYQYALNFRNSQVLNQLFFGLHPEFKR